MVFDTGFTFSYDPIGSTADNLLAFESKTATLEIASARVLANVHGLRFTNGTLNVSGDATFAADVIQENDTITQRGLITIGNHLLVDDMCMRISNGAIMRITSGGLSYQNIGSDVFVMSNELSTISFSAQTSFNVDEDVDAGIGRVELSERAVLNVADNKSFIGSLFELAS